MKTIAISAARKSLDVPVEGLFGRTRFFILVDPDTGDWEGLDNLANISAGQMVGVTTAQSLVRRNIKTVMTGKMRPQGLSRTANGRSGGDPEY
jgi:predicted Fe-Mo cluster-binding NifX family protein